MWYSNSYIVVKETITVTGANNRDRKNKSQALKNNAPYNSCISKINNVLIDNTDNLDVVMPMCNLIEYSKNYRKTILKYYSFINANPITNSE